MSKAHYFNVFLPADQRNSLKLVLLLSSRICHTHMMGIQTCTLHSTNKNNSVIRNVLYGGSTGVRLASNSASLDHELYSNLTHSRMMVDAFIHEIRPSKMIHIFGMLTMSSMESPCRRSHLIVELWSCKFTEVVCINKDVHQKFDQFPVMTRITGVTFPSERKIQMWNQLNLHSSISEGAEDAHSTLKTLREASRFHSVNETIYLNLNLSFSRRPLNSRLVDSGVPLEIDRTI